MDMAQTAANSKVYGFIIPIIDETGRLFTRVNFESMIFEIIFHLLK
jgi:hypothetical protein